MPLELERDVLSLAGRATVVAYGTGVCAIAIAFGWVGLSPRGFGALMLFAALLALAGNTTGVVFARQALASRDPTVSRALAVAILVAAILGLFGALALFGLAAIGLGPPSNRVSIGP